MTLPDAPDDPSLFLTLHGNTGGVGSDTCVGWMRDRKLKPGDAEIVADRCRDPGAKLLISGPQSAAPANSRHAPAPAPAALPAPQTPAVSALQIQGKKYKPNIQIEFVYIYASNTGGLLSSTSITR